MKIETPKKFFIDFLGYKYAMLSLKVMLSAVLRHYKFSSDLKMSDIDLKFGITTQIRNKHMVKIERRCW